MADEQKNLQVRMADGICQITLNRPKHLNVFNKEILTEFFDVLEEISNNGEVKVVVLLSACEKAFTAGADIKQMVNMGTAEGREWSRLGHKIARKLETLPQPVIIGINGYYRH